MAIVSLQELARDVMGETRLLGLDHGSKTLGVALSDLRRRVASPHVVLKRQKFMKDAAALWAVVDAHQVGGMVVGYPKEMDGTEGPRCQSVKAFVTHLLHQRNLPVLLWDERLSTAAVTRTLLEADSSRARRADVVDKLAACYILQGALDALEFCPP